MEPQIIQTPTDDEYQNMEFSFVRKRDDQIVNVRLLELLRQLINADFINNEITLNGDVCHLNSFRKKLQTITLTVDITKNGCTGRYENNGDSFREYAEFTVPMNTIKTIRIFADEGFEIDTVKDGSSNLLIVDSEGFVNVPTSADIKVTITFKPKVS